MDCVTLGRPQVEVIEESLGVSFVVQAGEFRRIQVAARPVRIYGQEIAPLVSSPPDVEQFRP